MTALRQSFSAHRVALTLATLLIAVLAALGIWAARSAAARDSAAVSLIAPTKAAALVAATSGEASVAVKAVGVEAQLINAAMPFDAAPVRSARPFDMPTTGTDHERALLCLTQAVYYEAGFEPVDGRRAVAQVVLNRMRHPAFPKSVCGVVYQGSRSPVCQFSFVCDGSLYRQPSAQAWKQARGIALAALGGYVEPVVGAATHYHADYVAPRWAPMLSKVAKLGAHIFYRWPGAWGQPAAFTGRYIGEPSDPLSLRPAFRPVGPLTLADGSAVAIGPVTDGTMLKRAPNDVGGLLDASKGWTLNIPMPSDSELARKVVAEQQQKAAGAPVTAEASVAHAQIASR